MSAIHPKADIAESDWHVRFVPAATWTVIFAITVGGVEHETEHTGSSATKPTGASTDKIPHHTSMRSPMVSGPEL
jgi:hypothetical protein